MKDDTSPLVALALYMGFASMVSVGGGVIMLAPDIHHYAVDVHHLISGEQFAAAYTLAQAAPGPNMLFVTLVGWQMGGWAGAILCTLAAILPTSLLTLAVLRLAHGRESTRSGRAFRLAMAPLSVGLLLAAALVLAGASGVAWHAGLLTLGTIAMLMKTKVNPVLLIGVGALAGLAGFV